jgi:isochorismate synthase
MAEFTKASPALSSIQQHEDELLQALLTQARELDYAFALWQLPESTTKTLIISFTHKSISPSDAIEELPQGFMFSPFDKDKQGCFLLADLSFSFANGSLVDQENLLSSTSQQFLAEAVGKNSKKTKNNFHTVSKELGTNSNKQQFEQLVKKGIAQIEADVFEKIVPSRLKKVEIPNSFDVIETFQKLCNGYPSALVSLVSIPHIGTWLGASPELLVSVESSTIFKTVALAGTKLFDADTPIKQVAWTQKEIEEQALVERYIISCFKKIRVREYEEHGPKTVLAGNLMHLKSDFTVDMKAINFPSLGSVMLQLLHPTSAVCGMPLEPAVDFIRLHEGYDREFYSGYLGPVNFQNNTNIFVNLRCMQLLDKEAVLYAGAGVTIDSVPEAEWEETEMKLNTLLNVIL